MDVRQKACYQDRSFPQVSRNEVRWLRGAGEEVGYGVGLTTATDGTTRTVFGNRSGRCNVLSEAGIGWIGKHLGW